MSVEDHKAAIEVVGKLVAETMMRGAPSPAYALSAAIYCLGVVAFSCVREGKEDELIDHIKNSMDVLKIDMINKNNKKYKDQTDAAN